MNRNQVEGLSFWLPSLLIVSCVCTITESNFKRRRSNSFHDQAPVLRKRRAYHKEDKPEVCEGPIPYTERHDLDVRQALDRLSRTSEDFPRHKKSLFSILSEEDKVYHMAGHLVPRCLRLGKKSSRIGQNEEIRVSKSHAILQKELGRGSYGVVALLQKAHEADSSEQVALKAQAPSGCLAWEYEILRKLRMRLKSKAKHGVPFPCPMAYLGLEDGAMMAMSAVSHSGITLLDLVNNYKSTDHVGGDTMPEILAIHYTCRMLHHIELLHSRGKILVCTTTLIFPVFLFLV